MAQGYKFREKPPEIERFLTEIEDNHAIKSDVDEKDDKIKNFNKFIPRNQDLKDGDKRAVNDGTNIRRYYKIDGKLYYIDLTEV